MNTQQIDTIVKCLIKAPCIFLGVFAKDKIPKLTRFPCCFVANTDKSHQSGTHWVAFYFITRDRGEFFDTYGDCPDAYGFTLPLVVKCNLVRIQSFTSSVCGQYCIYYIYLRSRGKSMEKIINSFSTDYAWNDRQVACFIRTHFPNLCSKSNSHSQHCVAWCTRDQ